MCWTALGISLSSLASFPHEVSGLPNRSFTLFPSYHNLGICQSLVDIRFGIFPPSVLLFPPALPTLAMSMAHLLMVKWRPKEGREGTVLKSCGETDDVANNRRQGSGHWASCHSNPQTSSTLWPHRTRQGLRGIPARTYGQIHQQCLSTWQAGKMTESWKYWFVFIFCGLSTSCYEYRT